MQFLISNLMFGLAPTPSSPGQQPNPTGQLIQMLGTVAIFGVIMYVLLFRPQQKRAKEHANLLKTLRPGDKIVTSGGVVGTVITVKEKTVSVRSADTKLEVLKSAVSEVTERGAESGTA